MIYARVTVQPDVGRSCVRDSRQWRLCASTQSAVTSCSHHCTSNAYRLCQHVQREKLHEIGLSSCFTYLLNFVLEIHFYIFNWGCKTCAHIVLHFGRIM